MVKNPFINLCCNTAPSAFDDCASTYECLRWLYEHLNKVTEKTEELNKITTDLKEYVDHYFDNLDVQSEINAKLDEMAESGTLASVISIYLNSVAVIGFDTVADMTSATNLANGSYARTLGYYDISDNGGATYRIRARQDTDVIDGGDIHAIGDDLVAELVTFGSISVAQFGAQYNDEDQSEKVQLAVDYAVSRNVRTITLDGDYYINATITVDGVDHLTIKDGTIRVHETDELLANDFNVLHVISGNDVTVENIKVYETTPVTRSRKLRAGGILLDLCTNSVIKSCYFEDTASGAMLYFCNNCSLLNNTVNVTSQSAQFAMSGILSYASSDTLISGNKVRGEYYDGMLSAYGASDKVIITDNIVNGTVDGMTSTYLSQGITIDSGVKNCICSNNYVEGCYYGIDNKSDVHNTQITGNTVKGCKFGITDRLGENVQASQTFNTNITNNKVIITEITTSQADATFLLYGKFYYVGISVADRLSCRIKGNDVTVYGTLARTVCGIRAGNSSSTNQYILATSITDNNVDLSSAFGSSYSNAPSGSVGYVLNNLNKGVITCNTFKVDTTSYSYAMFDVYGTCTDLNIQDNNAKCTNANNHNFITLESDASISNSVITGNKLTRCKFDGVLGFSNTVESSEYRIQGNRANKVNLVANTWATVGTITSPYDTVVQLKVRGMSEASGAKWVDGVYSIVISGTNITATAISEHKQNLDVQFVSTGSNRSFAIQAKSNVNINNFSQLFITDVMSSQPLTLA